MSHAENHDDGPDALSTKAYEIELARLQLEFAYMQDWARREGACIAVVFEGRDAAGKGGAIQRITETLNPRYCRHVALPAPNEREQTQWYFQRYIEHLPAAGEIALFDRNWYNRAGVERVFGFCTEEQHARFLQQAPVFEQMLVDDGITLIKYWFSVSDHEQEKRFQARIDDPTRRWKLSDIDLASRSHWIDYSRAKDAMFAATDTSFAPWHVVEADDKKRPRLNCIAHLLSQIPYEHCRIDEISLPKRQREDGYVRPDESLQPFVPDHAATIAG
jgi:polyphosphate kinase 2